MTEKILCVDDDPNILQGFKRALRKEFDITTAEGGDLGLLALKNEGPFAVVISDMRMPGMDGVQFLSRVKEIAPHTIRMMLTGNSDQQTAIDAVNEGSIFRFLSKPCPPEMLSKTLHMALEQYRLITAEKSLLEETLNNSLQVMVDILAMVNATAFSRSNRVKRITRDLAHRLGLTNAWEIEIAAMLSQIGCITIPEETLVKVNEGISLSEDETTLFQKHPWVAYELISRIPRMETVADIVAQQLKNAEDVDPPSPTQPDSLIISLGAKILRVVLDYDRHLHMGIPSLVAYRELLKNSKLYDGQVLSALEKMIEESTEEKVSKVMNIKELKSGMYLAEALISTRGELLLAAGQEITLSLKLRLNNFADAGIIKPQVNVISSISMG